MKAKRGKIFIACGLLLILSAIGLTIYNLMDSQRAGEAVGEALNEIYAIYEDATESEEFSTDLPEYVLNPKMPMPKKTVGNYDYIGVVKIPSCSLELPIISDWTYPALKVAPCRFSGSVYTDDLILAGHNYNSHFKKVRDVDIGEAVVFVDMAQNEFFYEVVEKETISGTDIELLRGGEWDLSLFTCTMSGSARMVIRCEKVE